MKQNEIKKIVIVLVFIEFVSKIKLYKFLFPLGGSIITLFSMLIIILIGYFCGLIYEFISCLVYSILKFIFAENIYHPLQGIIDYELSYLVFFISCCSLFRKNVNSLSIGFILTYILRLLFASFSGYIFFKEYIPNNFKPNIYMFLNIIVHIYLQRWLYHLF